jgi:spore coat protein SA
MSQSTFTFLIHYLKKGIAIQTGGQFMSNKPRIAIITPGIFPIPSPTSSSVETVVERITNSLSREVDFFIFGKKMKALPFKEKRGNISYIRFKNNYINNVLKTISKKRFNIIQIENRPKFITLVRQLLPEAKIWLSLHSTKYISKPHISREELILEISHTDKIIVNSHFLKKFVMDQTCCQEEKIFVNHLGVNTHQFQSKWLPSVNTLTENVKTQRKINGKNILLYVGRLRKIKGIEKLIKIMPAIIQKHPDTLLIIVGSAFYNSERITKYVNRLQRLAENLSEYIRFVPFVPHNEIHTWFQSADLVLVPSIGREAFGLVNVEAMACGVPVIASNNGGMPEIIQHGITGFLVDIPNMEAELIKYIHKMLDEPDLIQRMGENCVKDVFLNFTWERCSYRLLNEYIKNVQP